MPSRKKNSSTAAPNASTAALRRSTRNSKKPAPMLVESSSDELAPQNLPVRKHDANPTEPDNHSQEEIGDVITVRTTHNRSYSSSRPSTPNSNAANQSNPQRSASTTSKMEDVKMVDAGDDEAEDELVAEGPAMKRLRAASSRKGRSKYDNPEEMLTNPRSPLVTAKLRDILCSDKAWDILSAEEKRRVLAKFPDEQEVLRAGTPEARPDVAALRNNNNFRHDVARYQEDLGKGWHDPEWILQARAAHRKRQVGAYNDYLAARFREVWGVPMPGREEGDGQKAREVRESQDVQDAQNVQSEQNVQDVKSDEEKTTKAKETEREGNDKGDVEVPKDEEMSKDEEGLKDKEGQNPDAMQGVENTVPEDTAKQADEEIRKQENDVEKEARNQEQEHPPDTMMTQDEPQ